MTLARPVLFVGHDASRTGAPILLLHFLRWFKANTDIPFEIVLARGGPLQEEYESIGRVSVWPDQYFGVKGLAAGIHRRWLATRLGQVEHRLVYSNTMTNGVIVESLCGERPVVTHIHELETMIRSYGARNFELVKRQTRRYIACSEFVKANLVEHHQIDDRLIDVIHEFIEIGPDAAADPACQVRNRIFAALGIPAGSRVVGASGTTDWRKGPELFIQLARCVSLMRPQLPVHFVWVGGARPGTQRFEELQHDIRAIQMEDRIHFLGARPDALDCFRAFDVFALVSREDPFPLVCLEAASLGKPIVCFDGAGGMKEFIEQDCGFVVPYLDIEAMASRTVNLLESDDLRQRFGARAADKVRARHDVTATGPKIVKVIQQQL